MANKMITPKEMAKSLFEIVEKGGESYQKETGCTDKEKEEFKIKSALHCTGGLFYS